MGSNPHANGGLLLRDLQLAGLSAVRGRACRGPARRTAEIAPACSAGTCATCSSSTPQTRNFRLFGPDETSSNRLDAVFEVTDARLGRRDSCPTIRSSRADGRVMEVLSEHQCQGWLEGYLLTGPPRPVLLLRGLHPHRRFDVQPACQVARGGQRGIPWRRAIASLNILLTSHVWRQDHNGFSHQDPGFIDVVVNKKADVVRVYLPPDANTLLCVARHCLRSRNLVNVIVAGKQPEPQWLDIDAAIKHCAAGIGIFDWASNDDGWRAGCGHGLCGRCPDDGDTRGGEPAAQAPARI